MAIKRFILPINASGTIQNLRTTSVTQTTIALAWDAYPGATAYEVRRNGTLVSTTAGTTYSNSGHTAGTSYTYAVRPVVGGSGVASAQASLVVTTVGAGTLLLFDGFDYSVGREEANTTAEPTFNFAPAPSGSPARVSGWNGVKRLPTNTGAYGYLYTVTQAEMQATTGYAGPLPGGGARCLKMEVPPSTPQTDFYLQLYNGVADLIPANVWFQFWLYSPNYGSETGNIAGRQKFLYPSNNDYPSTSDKWLFVTTADSYSPYNAQPFGAKTSGQVTAVLRDYNDSTVWYSLAADNNDKLGPNQVSAANGYMAANQWTLWKIHFDTSTSNGVFEMWMRPYGGAWRKTHEWIGGATPGLSFVVNNPGGHRWLRMPSTFPGNAIPNTYGAYYYMDDFAMATTEAALPQYGV